MTHNALIVKLAAIGDVVMALPMVSALRAADPGTRVTWLCGTTVMPLLQCVEGIDELVAVDETAILAGSRGQQALAVMAAWRKLGGRRYDIVAIAHADPRYRILAAPVRAGERRWLGRRGARPGLVPARYLGDEYVRLVTGVDDGSARRFPPPAMHTTLDTGIAERIARPGSDRLVALAPGGAKNPARDNPLRRWPVDRYVALARELVRRGRTVVLTGTSSDAWVRPAFEGVEVIDLIGATTLPGLVALYARCAAVVTHDSGPLHLAGIAGTRVVGLFGPTSPSAMFRRDEKAILLWPGIALPCAPCYDGRAFAACADNRCMQSIAPETVVTHVEALLAN